MATDFYTIGMLLPPDIDRPVLTSPDQVFEYRDAFLGRQPDEGFIHYVMSSSRRGWLVFAVQELCEMAGISTLGFLYGSESVQYEWALEESTEGLGTWCVWKGLMLKPEELNQSVAAIATLFDWSLRHIPELSKNLLGNFADEEALRTAVTQPVITKEPTFDDRVRYADDGDGPWCLYAYLSSMQQLMRNALEENVTLLYMVQWPSPDPQAAQRRLAMAEFNSAPRYFYADGSAILKGDAVLFDGGRFPGLVSDFIVGSDADGKPYASAVLVDEGKPGQRRAVGLHSPAGSFAELHLVERDTADFVRAGINHLSQNAARGDATAQFNLGNLYVIGYGVAQDPAQGIAWWRKAADQGDALAQYHLGSMYFNGQGVAVDKTRARQWWRKAAEQGHAQAQFNVGVSHAEGLDTAKDLVQAALWYARSATQGYAAAQTALGIAYARGRGVSQDPVQACHWYRKAADQGNPIAQYNLAYAYQDGSGVAQDYGLAVEWYRKAAELGYAYAQCNLADKYEHGLGVQQDYAQALEWYKKSAAQGTAPAMYSLGGMYKNGLGVAPDAEAAAQWWSKAAALGYEDARKCLEAMNRAG